MGSFAENHREIHKETIDVQWFVDLTQLIHHAYEIGEENDENSAERTPFVLHKIQRKRAFAHLKSRQILLKKRLLPLLRAKYLFVEHVQLHDGAPSRVSVDHVENEAHQRYAGMANHGDQQKCYLNR